MSNLNQNLTRAERFTKEINQYKSPIEAAASQWGMISYTPFSSNSDPLIVDCYPYGHYTFKDGSQADIAEIGGTFYAYVSKSRDFKEPKVPHYLHRRNAKTSKSKAPKKSKPSTPKPPTPALNTTLAERILSDLRRT